MGASLSDKRAPRFAANDMKYVGKTAYIRQLTISLAAVFCGWHFGLVLGPSGSWKTTTGVGSLGSGIWDCDALQTAN